MRGIKTSHSGSPKRTLNSKTKGVPFTTISPANKTPLNSAPSALIPASVGAIMSFSTAFKSCGLAKGLGA